MMTTSLLSRLTVAALLLVAAPAAAQTVRWIAGVDLLIRVYAAPAKDGTPGPLVNYLGYDRDTGKTSYLDVAAQCHITWVTRPSPKEGAITHLMQFDARTFGYYHESGAIRIEVKPDSAWCNPVPTDQ